MQTNSYQPAANFRESRNANGDIRIESAAAPDHELIARLFAAYNAPRHGERARKETRAAG